MADLVLNRNDSGFDIPFTVTDTDGAAYDLTAHIVTFNISDKKYVNKLAGACTLVVAASGTCKYTVVAGDLDLPKGDYLGELELATVGGLKLTNVAKMNVKVVEECG